MNDLVSIYQTQDSFKANLIKSIFDVKMVFCFLKTNDASGVLPHLGFSQGGTEILIRKEDLDLGIKILQEFKDNVEDA